MKGYCSDQTFWGVGFKEVLTNFHNLYDTQTSVLSQICPTYLEKLNRADPPGASLVQRVWKDEIPPKRAERRETRPPCLVCDWSSWKLLDLHTNKAALLVSACLCSMWCLVLGLGCFGVTEGNSNSRQANFSHKNPALTQAGLFLQ